MRRATDDAGVASRCVRGLGTPARMLRSESRPHRPGSHRTLSRQHHLTPTLPSTFPIATDDGTGRQPVPVPAGETLDTTPTEVALASGRPRRSRGDAPRLELAGHP